MFSRSPGTTRCATISAGPTIRPADPRLGLDDTGPLLEQRVLQVAAGNADLAAERHDLVRGQLLGEVAVGGLELGGALDDPLERRAIDAGRRAFAPCYSCGGSGRRRGGAWTSGWRDRRPAAAGRAARRLDRRTRWGGGAARACACRNGRKSSIGIGKIVVELFSAAISVTVWR